MKNRKRVLSLILGVGLLLSGCGSTAQEQTAVSAVLVDVQEAEAGNLTLTNQFVGMISPQESVYIIPMAQGKVTETFFEVGDEVKEGDVLFKIDDTMAKIQLQQAKLGYDSTKQQADSALTTQQQASDLQLDASLAGLEAQYVAAQAQWKQASDAYDDVCDQYDKTKKALKAAQEAGADEATISELKAAKSKLADAKEQAELAYNTVCASYEAAEKALNTARASKDLTKGEVLEDTKKQLNTGLELAQVGVSSAELALSYYQVTTPISGKVIDKSVSVNGMATSASPAYIIAAEDTMTVTFQVSEAVRNTLSVDQKISVERNGVEYEGVITEIANAVGMSTGLFQIKALVKADGTQLPSGVSVKITSETYKAENDIIIPYGAVYYENEGAYVYVAKDGVAVKTYVTAGIFDDENIQIIDGVEAGDQIITSWSPRLVNGVEVETRGVEEAAK